MGRNKYYNIGMAPFNKLAEKQPSFIGNFETIDGIISRMASQHADIVEKFGYSYSLDLIYIHELSKYYSAITGIPVYAMESFVPTICKADNSSNAADVAFQRERAIIYPTFEHNVFSEDGTVAHSPSSGLFIVDKDDILFHENLAFNEEEDSMETMMNFLALFSKAAEYWCGKYSIDKKEEDILGEKMSLAFIKSGCALYKEDFIK